MRSRSRRRTPPHGPVLTRVAVRDIPAHAAELPQAGEEAARAGKEAAARTERMKQRRPRVDLRRVAGAAWAAVYPMGVLGPYTGLAHSPGGSRPRPSSAPSLQPSPSTALPLF